MLLLYSDFHFASFQYDESLNRNLNVTTKHTITEDT